ncbi:zinc finger MYM-type protein 3-like [Rhizophagus irregularis DAOM 181602=DAOM 197198]|nr:zinc finger MYM-type protein 3-like [Rhizophagus irregularis DAOM 181602=DAOM 197198]
METLSTSSNNSTKTNKLTTYERFVIPTNKDLQAIQAYSHIANTDDSTKTWMNLFNSYREAANFTNPLELLDDTTLQEQLCFAAIARGLSDIFYPNRIINIHGKHKWKRLHEIFDGRIKQIQDNQDTSRKKTDALEICEIKTILDSPNIQTDTPKDHSIKVNIPREKNNVGGAKNPYNSGQHNYIPPDLPNNYSPVADILLYQSKRPKNCKTSEFFLRINTPREIYHGNWFSDLKLGKNSHDNMLKNIVADCKTDANGRNLVNHSMRSTGISLWMLLGISHAEQMDITGHRTLAGISAYSTSTAQQRKKNVSLLIPQKRNADDLNEECLTKNFSNKKQNPLRENTSGNQGFIPASQLLRYDQLEIQSLEQDHKITQDSSKLPVINIENINIQNCNNVKVEVIVKPFE